MSAEEIVFLFNECITNLNEQKKSPVYQIKVSPNPINTKATIEFPNPNHSKYILSVFSISGNKVFEMDNIKSDKIEFKRGNLLEGVYLVEIKGEKLFMEKIIVLR